MKLIFVMFSNLTGFLYVRITAAQVRYWKGKCLKDTKPIKAYVVLVAI